MKLKNFKSTKSPMATSLRLLGLTSDEYCQGIQERLGKGAQLARLIYQEWYRTGEVKALNPAFNNAQVLLQEILSISDFSRLQLVTRFGEEHQTKKHLLATAEGLEIEMVLLPMKAGWTLCLSSQVGCRMGCAFCETGRMGLIRHLTTEEILSQLFAAIHDLKTPIRNIVFMGMGEPFDNYEAVMKAIDIMMDTSAFGIGPRHITVSTSGLVDRINQWTKEADPALNLAISLTGARDELRNTLMPVNRRFPLAQLRQAMEAYCQEGKRKIFIEYVMMEGKTDSLEEADHLAAYLKGLNVTVNLIPYNPQSRFPFRPSSDQQIEAFAQRVKEQGFRVFIRRTKGQKIMAACGQLGNRRLRIQNKIKVLPPSIA